MDDWTKGIWVEHRGCRGTETQGVFPGVQFNQVESGLYRWGDLNDKTAHTQSIRASTPTWDWGREGKKTGPGDLDPGFCGR